MWLKILIVILLSLIYVFSINGLAEMHRTGCFEEGETLDSLSYVITNNQSIEVNVNWSSKKDLRKALIVFYRAEEEYCYFIINNLYSETYKINANETNCDNFIGIIEVIIFTNYEVESIEKEEFGMSFTATRTITRPRFYGTIYEDNDMNSRLELFNFVPLPLLIKGHSYLKYHLIFLALMLLILFKKKKKREEINKHE